MKEEGRRVREGFLLMFILVRVRIYVHTGFVCASSTLRALKKASGVSTHVRSASRRTGSPIHSPGGARLGAAGAGRTS